jgi:hypothetical protein
MTKTNVIAVDTGLNALGWAVWIDVVQGGRPVTPVETGVIELKVRDRTAAWETRASMIMDEFVCGPWTKVARLSGVVQVLEMPEFRAGSAVGHAAAAGESLGMLYFMCGMHQQMASAWNAKTEFARVSEWKGTLPKEIVAKRIASAIGAEDEQGNVIRSHAWDAVGIGLWYLGHRLNDGKKFGGRK